MDEWLEYMERIPEAMAEYEHQLEMERWAEEQEAEIAEAEREAQWRLDEAQRARDAYRARVEAAQGGREE